MFTRRRPGAGRRDSSTWYTVGRDTLNNFGQLDDGVLPGGMQLHQVGLPRRRQLRRPALEFALRPGDRHTLAGPHPQQVDLELGERGQDGEEQLAHRIARHTVTPSSTGGATSSRLGSSGRRNT
jgi:hypothetical protein